MMHALSVPLIKQKDTFPITWKVVVVIPVIKRGKHSGAKNYRSISISKERLSLS